MAWQPGEHDPPVSPGTKLIGSFHAPKGTLSLSNCVNLLAWIEWHERQLRPCLSLATCSACRLRFPSRKRVCASLAVRSLAMLLSRMRRSISEARARLAAEIRPGVADLIRLSPGLPDSQPRKARIRPLPSVTLAAAPPLTSSGASKRN